MSSFPSTRGRNEVGGVTDCTVLTYPRIYLYSFVTVCPRSGYEQVCATELCLMFSSCLISQDLKLVIARNSIRIFIFVLSTPGTKMAAIRNQHPSGTGMAPSRVVREAHVWDNMLSTVRREDAHHSLRGTYLSHVRASRKQSRKQATSLRPELNTRREARLLGAHPRCACVRVHF